MNQNWDFSLKLLMNSISYLWLLDSSLVAREFECFVHGFEHDLPTCSVFHGLSALERDLTGVILLPSFSRVLVFTFWIAYLNFMSYNVSRRLWNFKNKSLIPYVCPIMFIYISRMTYRILVIYASPILITYRFHIT